MGEPNDQKSWLRYLRDLGWEQERGGNHQVKMTKPSCRPITLPMHKGQQYAKGMNSRLRREVEANEPSARRT